ncbi:MAG: response regulator [Bacteroidales bacterium]|nr:response regulator [Bacteroidales bacterium]
MNSNHSKTILLVEDSLTQQAHVKHILEVNQYRVITADNGKEALHQLRHNKVNLVISDVVMPEMDGLELCREIKNDVKLKGLPVILLTSLSKINNLINGLEAGADNYIPKPVNENFLLNRVKYILENVQAEFPKQLSNNSINIPVPNENRSIHTSPKVLMDYLLSTYEAILIKNQELEKTMDDLEEFNSHLEEMVESRTRQLLLETVERKQYQTSFEESEHKYKQLVNNAQIGVCIINKKGDLIFVNKGFCEMLRYKSSEVLNEINIEELYVDKDESKRFFEHIQKVKRIEGFETRFITQSGAVIHVLINAVFEKENISSFIMDISERILAAQQLQESEDLLNKITNAVHDAIIVLNSDNRITFWNPAAGEIFGYFESEAIGMDFIEMAISESYANPLRYRIEHKKNHHQNNGEKYWTAYGVRKDQSKFPLEYSISSINLREESFAVISLRDISERVENENKLNVALARAEESDKLKSSFLSNLSHEIRTPMNAIMGFSYLLADPKSDKPEIMEYLEQISKSCSNLLEIIDDIVDISRIETQEFKPELVSFDLNTLIRETFIIVQNNEKYKNPEIELRLSPEIEKKELAIYFDKTHLGKILINLIKNGIKFTKSGFVEIGYYLKDEFTIEFYIKDTGIGIPEEKLSLIFDKFRQLEDVNTKQYGGTGVGLTITKKLIELFGGTIWVESIVNSGTTIFFTIPFKQAMQSRQKTQSAIPLTSTKYDFRHRKILIAEDIESNFILLRTLLRNTHVEIIWVKDGREAVEYVSKFHDLHLILMDIQMPEMDGYEAMKKIREINSTIPVIAQTAYALDHEKEKIKKAGFDEYFIKPLLTEKLLTTIQRYFQTQKIENQT